jgi:peptidoglycan DL-endopeptidase CwlO
MRRHGLVIVGVLALAAIAATSARAHTTPQIQAQKEHARAVKAEVARIGAQLTVIEGRAQNAQYELQQTKASLASNTQRLRRARTNFHNAQLRIMQRLYSLYVSGKPTTLDVLAGATSLSQAIDSAEAAQAMSQQDSQFGLKALQYERVVQKREHELTQLRAKRADAVRSLNSQKRLIDAALAHQRRLLSSIHSSIHQLQVQEAQHEAALRAAAEARLRAEELAAKQAAPPTYNLPPTPPILGNGSGHPEAARIALQYLGVPYVWGGASPSGFDCSGLVMYVYAQLHISLPHYTVSQWDVTEPISTSEMQPGDLVFFDNIQHVGIYIGSGEFVDAPHTGSVVRIDSLAAWGSSFVGARRVP